VKRVLVVEDQRDLASLLAHNLKQEGLDVRTVEDGREALPTVRSWRPDLVILDLMLPYMGGEEFSAAMRDIEGLESTPVIIISASRYTEEVGARVGAKLSLRKPFDLYELTEHVNLLLR